MITNAKDILTAEMMANFLASIDSKEAVVIKVGDFEKLCKKDEIKAIWKSDELKAYYDEHQEQEFDIASESGNIMLLTHYDYSWWLENSRRINKLFKCLELEAEKKSEQQYTVACGMKKPGAVYNIHVFTGVIKDCIDFLNKDLSDKTLHNPDNHEIVLCMSFVRGQKNEWKTYQQLKDEGAIV